MNSVNLMDNKQTAYLSHAWACGFDQDQVVEELSERFGITHNFALAFKFIALCDEQCNWDQEWYQNNCDCDELGCDVCHPELNGVSC